MNKEIKLFGKSLSVIFRNEGDQAIADEVLVEREYRFCEEVIKSAKHAVIDIGGHLGFFALYVAILNPKVPIYSFEPHLGNYALLKENLKQNRIKNVFPKNLAVSNQVGEVELMISKEDLNHSIIHAIEKTGERQKVGSITLEKMLDRHQLRQVDLLKIDCEGAEFQILEDTSKDIFDRVSHIALEYHDWVPNGDHRRLKSFLEKQGYKVQDFPNHKMKELGFLWCVK